MLSFLVEFFDKRVECRFTKRITQDFSFCNRAHSSSETLGQLVGAEKSLNGREKIRAKQVKHFLLYKKY